LSKYVRKKKEMKKKKRWYGFLFSGPSKKAHAPPRSLYPSTKAQPDSRRLAAVPHSARAPSSAPSPTFARHEGDAPASAPSPTRARHEGHGDGAQARALSDGGAVPGSAAPPPASRQSPRALASVLPTPAGDPAYAPPSPLPPPLDRRRRMAPAAALRAAGGQREPAAAAPPKAVAPLWERCPIAKRYPCALVPLFGTLVHFHFNQCISSIGN